MHRFQAFAVAVLIAVVAIGFVALRATSGPATVMAEPGAPVRIDETAEEHALLRTAYEAKLANDAYVAYKSGTGSREYQNFEEEARIKQIRSRIAASVDAPPGTKLVKIPVVKNAPTLDGGFGPGEWDQAARIAIGVNGADTTFFIMATDENLYLACDVPGDTTRDGYDQMRFYYHLNISPVIVNERIHVGKSSEKLGGIRQTDVRWQGEPAGGKEDRWKKYAISDWSIYQHAFGASSVKQGHRRFEAVLNLDETGIPVGRPFPARVEVESDPVRDSKGKFKRRTYLGELGAQTAPVWFVIER